MFAYFPEHNIIINSATITHIGTILTSDKYPLKEHIIVRFVGGDFVEFPPDVTLYAVYVRLNEGD